MTTRSINDRLGHGGLESVAVLSEDNGHTRGILDVNGTTVLGIHPHPYYHFHGFAGNQMVGDGKFFDISGSNHGARGGDLSDVQMFTNAGYVSTVDPATGLTNSVIRIPPVNFDYAAGEKLIVWWLGAVTPEVSEVGMLGDGYGTAEGQRGWRWLVKTTGKLQINVYGEAQGYSGSTTDTVFNGALNSVAMVLDGENQKIGFWVNEVYEPTFGSNYWTFNTGTSYDTKSSNTVNIGTTHAASAASLIGIATKTRALVIMRVPQEASLPTPATFTDIFMQLRANPSKLILASAF